MFDMYAVKPFYAFLGKRGLCWTLNSDSTMNSKALQFFFYMRIEECVSVCVRVCVCMCACIHFH